MFRKSASIALIAWLFAGGIAIGADEPPPLQPEPPTTPEPPPTPPPPPAVPPMQLGIQAYRTGHYADAATHLSAAVNSEFNNAILHYYLGSTYVRLKRRDAAVREFRIAFALQPNDEVGRLSKQGLALLGIETGTNVDISSMFIVPAAPKIKFPADVLAAGGIKLAEMTNTFQTAWINRVFSPPFFGADHSGQLQPLGPEWRSKERFDDSKLPVCKCDGPWFRIPNWLAGTWKQTSDTVAETYVNDLKAKTERNGEASVAKPHKPERWGVVKDRQGTYWEHPCVPNVVRENIRGGMQVDVAVRFQPVELNTQKVMTYCRWINFQLATDYSVKQATQYEMISTYSPIGTGYCQKNESLKEFDDKGMPVRLSKYRYTLTEMSPPSVPARDASGRDYLTMFRKYLTDNKLADLMP